MKQKKEKSAELIDYQTKSVVSRTLVKKNGGTLTVFAFDKGEGLSEHSAPFEASVLSLEGELEIIIGGEKHLIQKDDFIIMPSNTPHSIKAIEKSKMLLIMIKEI